jgi:hypothetical protein
VALAVLGSVVAAAFPDPGAAPAPGPSDGVPVPPGDSYSSSAFCAAATGGAAASTIFLTNATDRVVTGTMTSVAPTTGSGGAAVVRRSVAVPARGGAAVNPSVGLPAGSTAASLVFDGGGVVAREVVSGPGGWSTAPCTSQISPQWDFAGGSTVSGNDLALALFDPSAAESVVNVSFLTPSGVVSPQPYQGLVVAPGGFLVENVGAYVQNATDIATLVTAQSGALVSSEFQQVVSVSPGGMALWLGSPALSTVWRFAQTTTQPQGDVLFHLGNPGPASVVATLSVGLTSGTVVPRRVTIPAQSVLAFSASGAAGLPSQVPFSLTITSSAPVLVGRTVRAPGGAPAPGWGASSATVAEATHWLVPAPGVPTVPGTAGATVKTLAVADPGPGPARVVVATLGSTRPVTAFTVGAGELVVLGPRLVGGLSALTVSSSQPVAVEEDDGPSGAPGVVSSTGFPFAAGP